jgi:4-amino-4-deoxy-L-arabinose transferase-like glycosyltransferase
LLLAVLAVFIASDMPFHPIVLWDESRLAVNAMEMHLRGLSLVTTYGFHPDLWNTKPPLQIWVLTACIQMFGPEAWALRLPTLIASVATLAVVMAFGWRLTRSILVFSAAGFLLDTSPGYFGKHVAESADYDALLCLFTTTYVLLLFKLVHQRRPRPWLVIAGGALIVGACMTKGVAGLIPGAGILTYCIATGRWRRVLSSPWYWLAGGLVVVVVGGFYWLRERTAPGYLAAVMSNELGGRFLYGMPGHVAPPFYYLWVVYIGFALGPALLLLPAAPLLRWRRTPRTVFLVYLAHVVFGFVVVHSLSRTQIFWYMAPVFPLLSIGVAVVLGRGLHLLARARASSAVARALYTIRYPALAMVAIALAASVVYNKFWVLPDQQNIPQGRYGLVFRQLSDQGIRRIRVIDGGVVNSEGTIGYTPQLWFHVLVWSQRGLTIRQDAVANVSAPTPGEVTVTCDESLLDAVARLGPSLTTVTDCAAVGGA